MTCDEAIQLLPWLLNGTLEEGERREVRQHLETCEECRKALGETRAAWTIFGQHLLPEMLVALAYGEVPSGIDPALAERHLASCPECAAELELARTSRRLEEDDKIALFPVRPARKDRGESRSWRTAALAASLAGLVAASGWIHSSRELRSVSEQVAEKPPVSAVKPARPETPSAGDPGLERKLAELTARFEALDSQAKEAQTTAEKLQAQIQESRKPRVNLYFENGAIERSADEILLPADQDSILTLDPSGPKTRRRIVIRSSAGQVVYEASGLLPSNDDYGQYSIGFPSGFLKPGRYTIRLFADGKPTPTETYTLRVK
ncbi:MAG TPA: zf-HC2 domain-containing protein [Thermoanaerobaculia bacterium]|nr:zf-HC2 domain-containing protein [Thermoanaerobaculia bacterium]